MSRVQKIQTSVTPYMSTNVVICSGEIMVKGHTGGSQALIYCLFQRTPANASSKSACPGMGIAR